MIEAYTPIPVIARNKIMCQISLENPHNIVPKM